MFDAEDKVVHLHAKPRCSGEMVCWCSMFVLPIGETIFSFPLNHMNWNPVGPLIHRSVCMRLVLNKYVGIFGWDLWQIETFADERHGLEIPKKTGIRYSRMRKIYVDIRPVYLVAIMNYKQTYCKRSEFINTCAHKHTLYMVPFAVKRNKRMDKYSSK